MTLSLNLICVFVSAGRVLDAVGIHRAQSAPGGVPVEHTATLDNQLIITYRVKQLEPFLAATVGHVTHDQSHGQQGEPAHPLQVTQGTASPDGATEFRIAEVRSLVAPDEEAKSGGQNMPIPKSPVQKVRKSSRRAPPGEQAGSKPPSVGTSSGSKRSRGRKTCRVCGKTLGRARSMKKHLASHTVPQPKKASVEPKRFAV